MRHGDDLRQRWSSGVESQPSKPLISLQDAGSGWKIGGGRCPLMPDQLDR
jgi:hypothetical protein